MKLWTKIKCFFGFCPEVTPTITVNTEPKVEEVAETTLPKGIVTEPKGIKKGAPKHKVVAKTTKPAIKKTTPAVDAKLKEVKKAVKAETKKTPAKKPVAKKVAPKAQVATKKVGVKAKGPAKSWYNNGKEQKLLPNDQDTPTGFVKGRLPKKDK